MTYVELLHCLDVLLGRPWSFGIRVIELQVLEIPRKDVRERACLDETMTYCAAVLREWPFSDLLTCLIISLSNLALQIGSIMARCSRLSCV